MMDKIIYAVTCEYRDGTMYDMYWFESKTEAEEFAEKQREDSVAHYRVHEFLHKSKI